MQEIFSYYNFFDSDDLAFINQAIAQQPVNKDVTLDYGNFPNVKIANYVNLLDNEKFTAWMMAKIRPVFDQDFVINSMYRILLFKPWDIHSDYFLDACKPGYRPYYNCLVSLEDAPSSTIVFDQVTRGANDFYLYKESNLPVDNPVPEEFWQEHLDFCWPQDRLYLTVKQVLPEQRAGQFQGFPRQYFHSSDNFHNRMDQPKQFLHIRTDIKDV